MRQFEQLSLISHEKNNLKTPFGINFSIKLVETSIEFFSEIVWINGGGINGFGSPNCAKNNNLYFYSFYVVIYEIHDIISLI